MHVHVKSAQRPPAVAAAAAAGYSPRAVRPRSARATTTHVAWQRVSLDQRLAENMAANLAERPRRIGEASPTRDEWLRAARVYSSRVAASATGAATSTAAATSAAVAASDDHGQPQAASPRAPAAGPSSPKVAVAELPPHLRASRGPTSDALWEDLHAFRTAVGRTPLPKPPAPRTPSQLCVIRGAGTLEGRPDERMWSEAREAVKGSEGYQRIERICERAKALKVERPWEPSWERAGERLSIESFEAARERRRREEGEGWSQIGQMIGAMGSRLQAAPETIEGTAAETDVKTDASDALQTPNENAKHGGAGDGTIHGGMISGMGGGIPSGGIASGGIASGGMGGGGMGGGSMGGGGMGGGSMGADRSSSGPRTLGGLVAAGRRPTTPLDGWSWRMPLPLQGPFEQLLQERSEARRPRPLRACLPTYSATWSENDGALAYDGQAADGSEGFMAPGGSPGGSPGGTLGGSIGTHRPLSASSRQAGVRCDPATGRMRFKPPVPRFEERQAPSVAGPAPNSARQPSQRRPESPIPGPWKSSRPNSGASLGASRPCSRPWSRPSSGAYSGGAPAHARPATARPAAGGGASDAPGVAALAARPFSALVSARAAGPATANQEGANGEPEAELHWAEVAAN
jgi:hypothetical protein